MEEERESWLLYFSYVLGLQSSCGGRERELVALVQLCSRSAIILVRNRELVALVQLCSRSTIILWRNRELVVLVQLCSRSAIILWRK